MIDPDVRKDDGDWNDYVNGVDRRFCPTCSYLLIAHWHTDGTDKEWYACPSEGEAKAWWGR